MHYATIACKVFLGDALAYFSSLFSPMDSSTVI